LIHGKYYKLQIVDRVPIQKPVSLANGPGPKTSEKIDREHPLFVVQEITITFSGVDPIKNVGR
jgi:hypothetical protein